MNDGTLKRYFLIPPPVLAFIFDVKHVEITPGGWTSIVYKDGIMESAQLEPSVINEDPANFLHILNAVQAITNP